VAGPKASGKGKKGLSKFLRGGLPQRAETTATFLHGWGRLIRGEKKPDRQKNTLVSQMVREKAEGTEVVPLTLEKSSQRAQKHERKSANAKDTQEIGGANPSGTRWSNKGVPKDTRSNGARTKGK